MRHHNFGPSADSDAAQHRAGRLLGGRFSAPMEHLYGLIAALLTCMLCSSDLPRCQFRAVGSDHAYPAVRVSILRRTWTDPAGLNASGSAVLLAFG
jgi:hypothetical protein